LESMKSQQALLLILIRVKLGSAFYISNSQRSIFQLTTTLPPIQSLVSQDEENQSSLSDTVWLTYAEIDALSNEVNQPHEDITAFHTDVTLYEGSNDRCNSGKPSIYRLNKHSSLLERVVTATTKLATTAVRTTTTTEHHPHTNRQHKKRPK